MAAEQTHHYKIMKKIATIFLIFIFGFLAGFSFHRYFLSPFQKLSVEQMQSKISDYLTLAIKKAEEKGIYNCCVEPSCTMCFLESNIWNNQKAGRCNCASFVRQGKDPCFQCKKILSQSNN